MSVNYSLGAGKPLISREQNYVLDRKLLTVHSEDRDISKWPNSNEFEIILPQQLLNIQSMRLVEVETPPNLYVFSNLYQNTKMVITQGATNTVITIKEGTYTALQLAQELQNKLTSLTIEVHYDSISQKYIFIDTAPSASFNFSFNTVIDYSYNCLTNKGTPDPENIFNRPLNWGLGYYLGFNKKLYTSINTPTLSYYDSLTNTILTTGSNYYIVSDFAINIDGDKCMYMEVAKYNSYDELYPYNQSNFDHNSSSNIQLVNSNNSNSGKIKSAFAKIPLNKKYGLGDGFMFESRNIGLENITHFEPPLERLARLKFKFRFHDGRLVDFQQNPFDFTIEFNMLRDEMGKQYNVRIPLTYTL